MSTRSGNGFTLMHYVTVLKRRIAIVLACVLLGTGLAAAYALRQPPRYTSTTQIVVSAVLVNPADVTPRLDQVISMDTEAQILRSGAVRTLVERELGDDATPGQVLNGLDVVVPPSTFTMRISFSHRDPAVAQAGAAAYAIAYLDLRAQVASEQTTARISRLQRQISEADGQLDEANRQLRDAAPGSGEERVASARAASLSNQIGALQAQRIELEDSSITPGQVITEATEPLRTGRSPLLFLAAGFVLGLAVGVTLAFLRERSDPRVLDVRELPEELEIPVLSIVPRNAHHSGEPQVRVAPEGAPAEAYRRLRNEIFVGSDEPPQVLAICPAGRGSASHVTANLALVLSRAGRTVRVIGTDFHTSYLTDLMELGGRPGLGDALTSRYTPDETLAEVAPLLSVIPPGNAGPEALDLLASSLLTRFVDLSRREAEIVLLDAPSALSAAGQAVLTHADAVVLVASIRRTRRRDVVEARTRVERAGAALLGAVLIPASRGRKGGKSRRDGETAKLPPSARLETATSRPGVTAGGHRAPEPDLSSSDRAGSGASVLSTPAQPTVLPPGNPGR